MKLRELLYMLGMPRPATRTYGHEVVAFDLPGEGHVQLARWLHPAVQRHPNVLDQDAIDALRTFLRPGDVVVDIGAHAGDTTVPLALAVGPTGAVLAFEPNRHVFPVLAANAALNPGRVRIIPCMFAAAQQPGKMTFEYGDPGFCNGGRHEGISRWRHGSVFELEVEAVRVEDYLRAHHPDLVDRIRFVKIDAEGFDRFIVESLRGLLTRLRPYLLVEVNVHNTLAQRLELLALLRGLGYGVERVRSEADLHGEAISEANLMQWKHYDVFCTPLAPVAGASSERR